MKRLAQLKKAVSVPSRGLCFQSKRGIVENTRPHVVSVPSRGLCFQSIISKTKHIAPPRFRPLSGIVFSISEAEALYKEERIVSVPSRGLCFQSKRIL